MMIFLVVVVVVMFVLIFSDLLSTILLLLLVVAGCCINDNNIGDEDDNVGASCTRADSLPSTRPSSSSSTFKTVVTLLAGVDGGDDGDDEFCNVLSALKTLSSSFVDSASLTTGNSVSSTDGVFASTIDISLSSSLFSSFGSIVVDKLICNQIIFNFGHQL